MTVAFTLPGGVPVFAFSLLVGAGASLGMSRLISSAPGEARGRSTAAGFAVLVIALIGGRVVYQLNHPAAAVELPLGGLSWGGALLSGWAALPFVALFAGTPAVRLADLLFPISATVITAAWLGCWVDGCAYGPISDAWYGLAARDDWGNIALRFPVQLLGACLAVLTLVAADLLRTRIVKPGLTAGLWLTATGLQLWWLQALRVDPAPVWNGLPLNLWGAWAVAAEGIILSAISLVNRLKVAR